PFYKTLEREDNTSIYIPNGYQENFASQVLPVIDKLGKLKMDQEVEKSIYKPELQANIYLDKKDELITIDVKFVYGDIEINPFQKEAKKSQDDRILVRNMEKEGQIMNLLEEADFKVSSEYIYLEE